ncbi:MAG: hypothetical protein QG632_891 [Candidatus Dependentiae bacterium]|nr:hypothetical protein [Candidatus Dependentiae bacterium]
MPGYKTHASAAVGSAALLIAATHTKTPFLAWFCLTNLARLVAGLLGGLFPDIDIKSKGQQILYALVIPLLVAALLAKHIVFSILLSALAIISPLLPHRGITHNFWFILGGPLAGPLLVYVYCPEYTTYALDLYIYFVVGAISHIALDYGPYEMLMRAWYGARRRSITKTRRK